MKPKNDDITNVCISPNDHYKLRYDELQLQRKTADDAVLAQQAVIRTAESRLAQIDIELRKFDESLVDVAFTNYQNMDWARYAIERLGLELEKSTLPAVISRLNDTLPGLHSAAARTNSEIDRLLIAHSDDDRVETIRGMLADGKTQRFIQTESGLPDHDFLPGTGKS